MTFPSQRTQPSIRTSWLGRHTAGLGIGVGTVVGIATTLVANLKLDVDPLKAITQYGLPTALCIFMGTALGWLVGIYIPRIHQEHQETLRQINAAHADQMGHLRDVIDAGRESSDRERQLDREQERETITAILDRHAALVAKIDEVKDQAERINDRLDSFVSGQHRQIPARRPAKEG